MMDFPRQPEIHTPAQINNWSVSRQTKTGSYIPARSYGHNLWPLKWRWIVAWNVLIGKLDALDWQEEV